MSEPKATYTTEMDNSPDRIYLHDLVYETVWCDEPVDDGDIEYIKAATVSKMRDEINQVVTNLLPIMSLVDGCDGDEVIQEMLEGVGGDLLSAIGWGGEDE